MTSGGNNFKLCPPNFLIFVPPPRGFLWRILRRWGAFGRHWLAPTEAGSPIPVGGGDATAVPPTSYRMRAMSWPRDKYLSRRRPLMGRCQQRACTTCGRVSRQRRLWRLTKPRSPCSQPRPRQLHTIHSYLPCTAKRVWRQTEQRTTYKLYTLTS